ncbi:RICIN domain-containing protein [Umezawaea endophytica]|uniref:RICIN domain-containing protein n=1 Tax=Umezawaea endophytica TaxID=1654476 RepID=A0A9X2VX53_9PSEU|nr:RICIN domain-containing protein [Umezawaea endophytica]MCS7483757.1 RICIN domain-containing protein [Umezawaea endophytica]
MRIMIARVLAAVLVLLSMAAFTLPAGAEGSGRSGYGISTQDVTALDFFDRYRNQATGQYLDDSWEYGLRALPNYNNDHQLWNVHRWADNTFEIRNVVTGRCLDDSFEYGFRTVPCYANTYQSWYVTQWADGTVTLENQQTRRVIDHSWDFGLRTFGRNNSAYQRW